MTLAPGHAHSVAPSDAELERVVDALRQAVGAGVLTLDQFEERLNAACAATTLAELKALIPWVNQPRRSSTRRLQFLVGSHHRGKSLGKAVLEPIAGWGFGIHHATLLVRPRSKS